MAKGYKGGFKAIEVRSQSIKGLSVELHWECGEGLDGDYMADDPNDVPLLRFDVLYKGEQIENASYCTQLKATDKRPLLLKAAKCILKDAEDSFYEIPDRGLAGVGKRQMEQLSWIGIENGKVV